MYLTGRDSGQQSVTRDRGFAVINAMGVLEANLNITQAATITVVFQSIRPSPVPSLVDADEISCLSLGPVRPGAKASG